MRFRLGDRDFEILRWAARWPFVCVDQVMARWAIKTRATGYNRMQALAEAGLMRKLLRREGYWAAYSVTSKGSVELDIAGREARINAHLFAHDKLVVDMATFLELKLARELVTEPEMHRSNGEPSLNAERPELAWAVDLGQEADEEGAQSHRPDLWVLNDRGGRDGVEIETSQKSQRRWRRIVAGYVADPRVELAVWYSPKTVIRNGLEKAIAAARSQMDTSATELLVRAWPPADYSDWVPSPAGRDPVA